jgi:hypothetical protein
MQQQSAQSPALADRPIAVRPRPPPPQRQFARVLNHDHVATASPGCRARRCVAHHLVGGHRAIAQEAPKPHLLRSPSCEPPDTRARALNQGCMQGSPPFSRRRSPNRPSPNSIVIGCSANQPLTHGISLANWRQLRCVHTIAACGERATRHEGEPELGPVRGRLRKSERAEMPLHFKL